MFNHKLLCMIALLSACARANFVFVTGLPTEIASPTFTNAAESASWQSSFQQEMINRFVAWEETQPQSFFQSFSSALGEWREFAATATYSIPSAAIATDTLTTITTIPEWYTALPEDVKTFNDINASLLRSILREIVATTTSSVSASTSARSTGAAPTGGGRFGAELMVAAFAGAALL